MKFSRVAANRYSAPVHAQITAWQKTALQSQNTRKKDLHLKKRCAIIFRHYARRCRAGRVPFLKTVVPVWAWRRKKT